MPHPPNNMRAHAYLAKVPWWPKFQELREDLEDVGHELNHIFGQNLDNNIGDIVLSRRAMGQVELQK